MTNFSDGLKSLFNNLINRRNALNNNEIVAKKLSDETLRQMFRTGVPRKIVKLKSSYALNDTLVFEKDEDRLFYEKRMSKIFKKAAMFMQAFGRGLIVIHSRTDNRLDLPLKPIADKNDLMFSVFSGDNINALSENLTFPGRPRYREPTTYNIRGTFIHYTRCIDLRYFLPSDQDAQQYEYGGISEYELCIDELINLGIIRRASAGIVEKASNLFYKIAGFKQRLEEKRETPLLEYVAQVADYRGISGDSIIDAEDDIVLISQQLNGVADIKNEAIRDLAMVTGIPVSELVGETVRGLNATGENEQNIKQAMVEDFQQDFLIEPLRQWFTLLNMGDVSFKENQGQSARAEAETETVYIDNATKLELIGQSSQDYLEEKGMLKYDKKSKWLEFDEVDDEEEIQDIDLSKSLEQLVNGNVKEENA